MGKNYFDKCRLCQNDKKLCFSHIIPEFLFLPIYDEKHRASMIPRGKTRYEQKGIREYLLCGDCEQIISMWETYVSPIIKSIQDLDITRLGDQYIISDVQYANFKLFQLSML
ncbi:MAG: hypothetical protein GYA34_04905 [Chloroflexi bacterium]|nr:hypothetical protein [Chloroflexota bacterium]